MDMSSFFPIGNGIQKTYTKCIRDSDSDHTELNQTASNCIAYTNHHMASFLELYRVQLYKKPKITICHLVIV